MCLVLIALDSHPDYRLIVAANRDEFYDRPTAPAGFWADAPSVLAGRDLKAGGTWLVVDRRGRLAAVTNYRQGERESPAPRSRGRLVSDFLMADTNALEHIERVRSEAGLYNGFNLIAGDASGLFYYSNREGAIRTLTRGLYGLSNHLLDTPWPKVVSTKSAFGVLLSGGASELTADLFGLLSDRDRPADDLLPSTGVGREWERLLSSAFIASDGYGTRSSTVVLIGRDGSILFIERSFGPGGVPGAEVQFEMSGGKAVMRGGRKEAERAEGAEMLSDRVPTLSASFPSASFPSVSLSTARVSRGETRLPPVPPYLSARPGGRSAPGSRRPGNRPVPC